MKTLQENGSPAPHFTTDDDRTFFEVELFIPPDFEEKTPFVIEDDELKSTPEALDTLLEKLINYSDIIHDLTTASAIAGIQAGNVVNVVVAVDNQMINIISSISSNIAGSIADTIARCHK